jgi:hypothetical protein
VDVQDQVNNFLEELESRRKKFGDNRHYIETMVLEDLVHKYSKLVRLGQEKRAHKLLLELYRLAHDMLSEYEGI